MKKGKGSGIADMNPGWKDNIYIGKVEGKRCTGKDVTRKGNRTYINLRYKGNMKVHK